MSSARYLAIDLGAESGRGFVGETDGRRLVIEEVHRFPNRPFRLMGHLHWNVWDLYAGVMEAIGRASAAGPLASLAVDTWAVDYALLGPGDALLGAPYHYRDGRTDGVMEAAFAVVGPEEIFARTGIQFLPFNTLYQLIAAKRETPATLEAARDLLMMGELFTFLLTGEKVSEYTNASTTQLLDAHTRSWATPLFDSFGLPQAIMRPVVEPGTPVGRLLASVARESGAGRVPVVVPAVHDTACAVAAVPAEGDDWAYLSSGTWSLLGVETARPVLTPLARRYDLTNEGGVGGSVRLLKNVMGLWILQECRRRWAEEGDEMSYEELVALAEEAPPFRTLVDPDDRRFLTPGGMPEKIKSFARESGQPLPEGAGAVVRCVLESLALKYRAVLERLEEASGRSIRVIHIVGGGSENRLLNQWTANATGRLVLAGPKEATAIGNLLVQAMADGVVGGLAAGRQLVRRSFPCLRFEPEERAAWDEAYGRFAAIIGREPGGGSEAATN